MVSGKEPLREHVSDIRSHHFALKPNYQLWVDMNAQFIAYADDGLPTIFRIRAVRRTLHESDMFVTKLVQMHKRHLGRTSVIQDQIRHTLYLAVSSNGYCRKCRRFVD